MKKQAIAVFAAILVVLASTGLRKAFAKAQSTAGLWNSFSVTQPGQTTPSMVPLGVTPAPVHVTRTVAAIGSSPVPFPPYRTVAAIGSSPVPFPPYRTVAA
ncbi:MAG: hypothetical protein KGM47_11535, partial [Acidobacteriota bacterium]|nr:hypothetical protein [Acidobacteriota bacterium]